MNFQELSFFPIKLFVCKQRYHGPLSQLSKKYNATRRKLSYRKDDRAMRPIHGCPENIRESLSTPTATFAEIFNGLLFRSNLWMCVQNLKFVVPEIIGGTQTLISFPRVSGHFPLPCATKRLWSRRLTVRIYEIYDCLEVGNNVSILYFQWIYLDSTFHSDDVNEMQGWKNLGFLKKVFRFLGFFRFLKFF